MKIIVHGPLSTYGPDGGLASWAPDQLVEIHDSDKRAVAWARVMLDSAQATLVEDTKTSKAEPKKTADK